MVEFKVVECSVVTDENLTRILNEWVNLGWHFDTFNFAMRDGSHRPSMAFAIFKREVEQEHI